MKIASLLNKRNASHVTTQKPKKDQRERTNAYRKEQERIQGQDNKIRNWEEYRKLRIALQTVNQVNRRKSISKAKLKPVSQEERIQKWKEHFKNLL